MSLHDAIHDQTNNRGIAGPSVPTLNRQLAGHNRDFHACAIADAIPDE